MKLKDLKNKDIKYDWKTIFVGIEEGFFSKEIFSDYAVELLMKGEESGLINELAWGVSEEDLGKVMLDIKIKYFPQLDEESTILVEENRKLRFVYLSKMKENYREEDLLNKVAEFYGNHHYPEDMIDFINYMPQEAPTTKKDLLDRFDAFLKLESLRYS